jgi:predicted nucleic acid-binding Zn ribbon protein
MQKMADKPLTKCIKCGGRLEKQWSSTSFQLKGTGWYVTDYAAKKSDVKSESKESKTTASEEKSEKAEQTSTTASEKSSKTETATKSTDKTPTLTKKSTSKDAPSNTSGD